MTGPEEPTGELLDEADDIFPDTAEPRASRRPITARGVALTSARVVTGAIGIAVAVAAIAGAALLPLPVLRSEPSSVVVVPVPTGQQLVCPGSILRLSDDTGQGATVSSAIGRATLRSFTTFGAVDSTPLTQSDAGTGDTPAAPTVVSTAPNPADPTEVILISGAQSQDVNEGDFVGLAAAGCATVSGDSWISGGSTAVGRTTLLTLSNPTEVPATVDLELFSERGAIAAPGTSGIVVPASGQRVLSLAGFQPNMQMPVIHVTSVGGQVVAELQQSIVRGLQPGGVDIVPASAGPLLDSVIPGLVVVEPESVEALQGGGETFEDLRTVLRLFAPGEGTVSTTISVVPEDGVGTGTSFALEIDAGRVTEVPITDLAAGNYTVRVSASVPLIASARVSTVSGDASDFAWLSSAPLLNDQAVVTIAPGPGAQLHLANSSSEPITVTLEASAGDDLTVDIGTGAAVSVDVQSGTSYELSGFADLHATVSLSQGGKIAAYPVLPPGVGSSPVTIFP